MRETVLDPLGMKRSSYLWREDSNSAWPHSQRGRPSDYFKAITGKDMLERSQWKVGSMKTSSAPCRA
jgi:CubicO group peptidase (beta-lactamase class C family)